ncbi:hypothetical protein Tco_0432399 [Tanacetum coccineum]
MDEDDFDCYDGYEAQVYDLPEQMQSFCDKYDIRINSRVRKNWMKHGSEILATESGRFDWQLLNEVDIREIIDCSCWSSMLLGKSSCSHVEMGQTMLLNDKLSVVPMDISLSTEKKRQLLIEEGTSILGMYHPASNIDNEASGVPVGEYQLAHHESQVIQPGKCSGKLQLFNYHIVLFGY